MNALKSYKKRKIDEKAREILFEGMDGFIEHVDLLTLYVLYAEFGFDAEQLRHFFWAYGEHYEAFRDTFIQPGDETRFYVEEKRMDTVALKKYLLDIGFDYDAEWKDYFEERMTYKMSQSLKGRKSLLYLWNKQNRICPLCGEKITAEIQWNVREKVIDGNCVKYLVHDKCYKQNR